jgi:hypothetical protein
MIFAVIGIVFKSDLLLIEGSVDTDQCIHNLDHLGLIEALNAKYGPFGWIFQCDGAHAHTSQEALAWLEESVDVIVDWPANSPDLSPIELLWTILKKLVKRINPENMEELKSAVIVTRALIPQATIDKLCQRFQTPLEFCLARGSESISNDLLANFRASRPEEFSDWEPGLNSVDRSRGPTADQGLAHDRPAMAAVFKEMGNAKPMPVEEPMVSNASAPVPRFPAEYSGSRNVP